MKLINCTPHEIVMYSEDGKTILATMPASGYVARVITPPQAPVMVGGAPDGEPVPLRIGPWAGGPLYYISPNGIPVVEPQDFSAGQVTGLPPLPELNEIHAGTEPGIVVSIVGAESVAREWPGWVFATDTGPESVVRDGAGRILGVKRLQRIRSNIEPVVRARTVGTAEPKENACPDLPDLPVDHAELAALHRGHVRLAWLALLGIVALLLAAPVAVADPPPAPVPDAGVEAPKKAEPRQPSHWERWPQGGPRGGAGDPPTPSTGEEKLG